MIYPFLILLLVPLLALIVICYQQPKTLDAPSFEFTRRCLGVAIFTYAASLISIQSLELAADTRLFISLIAQILAWIFLIFSIRGIFEVLAGK